MNVVESTGLRISGVLSRPNKALVPQATGTPLHNAGLILICTPALTASSRMARASLSQAGEPPLDRASKNHVETWRPDQLLLVSHHMTTYSDTLRSPKHTKSYLRYRSLLDTILEQPSHNTPTENTYPNKSEDG